MTLVVYENEPFEVAPEDESFLAARLGSNLKRSGRSARIIRVAGHLQMPGGRVLTIRTRKADSASLLSWLAYADPSLGSLSFLGSLPERAGEADFGSLVARVFCVETWRAIQTTGLLRSYHRQAVESAVVRGRIDFARLARNGGNHAKTPCIVFSRLPATPLNRLLAATVRLIGRDPWLRAAAGPSLPPLVTLLSEVDPHVDDVLLSGRRPLSRLEQPFSASVALADVLFRGCSLGSGARLRSASFLLNLANLFEKAVARAFVDSPLDATPKLPVRILREQSTGERRSHMPMEVDVMLRVGNELVIVDAKYKRKVSADNLQQMTAYAWLTGARRAVLVFPKGQLRDTRSFVMPNGSVGGQDLRVDLAELDLAGHTQGEWRRAAGALVDAVLNHVQPRPSTHIPMVGTH